MHVIEEETENKKEIIAIKRAFDFISYLMKKSLLGNSSEAELCPFISVSQLIRRKWQGEIWEVSCIIYPYHFIASHEYIKKSGTLFCYDSFSETCC